MAGNSNPSGALATKKPSLPWIILSRMMGPLGLDDIEFLRLILNEKVVLKGIMPFANLRLTNKIPSSGD